MNAKNKSIPRKPRLQGYKTRPTINKPEHVAIIGGGIASACAAYALCKQGIKVTLYCKDNEIAQGASSNAIGALYPLLHQQQDNISDFYQQAFWRAKSLYKEVLDQGFYFSHQWCGVLDIAYKASLQNRQKTFEQLNAWPPELIQGITAEQASEKSGIELPFGGLFMPNAGWICPPELVTQLFKAAHSSEHLTIKTETVVNQLEQTDKNHWALKTNKGDFKEGVVIVCGGADTLNINIVNSLPLTAVRGQITSLQTNIEMNKLSTVLCHKGYLTPAHHQQHSIGATFDKDDYNIETKKEDDDYNLTMLERCLPTVSDLSQWHEKDITKSKARLRCMTPDHLPMVGAMPDINAHKLSYPHLAKDKKWSYEESAPCLDNLYVMTGLGARGLCSAPLIADILTADICGTPYPMDKEALFNLSANRFVIRDIIKGDF
jgi:tRNA 5-methylaminomethyl-2-thiouridine biosynthesis bifunctional protein